MAHRRRRLRAMMMQACVLCFAQHTRRLACRTRSHPCKHGLQMTFCLLRRRLPIFRSTGGSFAGPCASQPPASTRAIRGGSGLFFRDGYLHSRQESHAQKRTPQNGASVQEVLELQELRARGARNECAQALRVRIETVRTALVQLLKRCAFAAQQTCSSEIGLCAAAHGRDIARRRRHTQRAVAALQKWTTGRTRSSARTNMGIMAATTKNTYKRNGASSTSNDDGARATTGLKDASCGSTA